MSTNGSNCICVLFVLNIQPTLTYLSAEQYCMEKVDSRSKLIEINGDNEYAAIQSSFG